MGLVRQSWLVFCVAVMPTPAFSSAAARGSGQVSAADAVNTQNVYASWDEMLQRWRQRRLALQAGELSRADAHLLELIHMKARSTWPDVFPLGVALRHEARFQREQGASRRARAYAMAAVALAPNDTNNHWALMSAQLSYDWTEFGKLVRIFSRVTAVYLRDWKTRHLLLGNAIIWLLISGLLYSFVLLALWYLRHGPYWLHDVQHIFPRGTTSFQVGLVLVVLLVAPVLFRVGFLWYLVLLVGLIWISLSASERVLASLLVLAWIVIALVLPLLLIPIERLSGAGIDRYYAFSDPSVEPAFNRLLANYEQWQGHSSLDGVSVEELYIMGTRALRAGALPGLGQTQTLQRARTLLTEAASRQPWSAHIQTALGVVYMRSRDVESAIGAFKAAIQRDPGNVEAYFNLSRIYYQGAEPGEGRALLDKASQLEPRLTVLLSEAARQYGASFMVLSRPSEEVFLPDDSSSRLQRYLLADQVWRYLAAWPRAGFVGGGLGFWLLLIMSSLFGRSRPRAMACPRCYKPLCQRCHPELPDTQQCHQCYRVFVLRDVVDSRERVDKEISIHRQRTRREVLRKVLSFLLAGSVQILDARVVGAFMLWLFMCSLVLLLSGLDVVQDVLPMGEGGLLARGGLGGALLLVSLFWSWLTRSREA